MNRLLRHKIARTLLLSTLCANAATALAGGPLEIKNRGFEGGLSHWSTRAGGGYGVDEDVFRSGTRSVRIRIDEQTRIRSSGELIRFGRIRQKIEVTPHALYTFRVWVKTEIREGYVGLNLIFRNRSGRSIPPGNWWRGTSFLPIRETTDGWKELVYSFETPPGCAVVVTSLFARNLLGTVWFDDASIQRGMDVPGVPETERPPVIDGKIGPGEWENALVLCEFLKCGSASRDRTPAEVGTEVWMLTDHRHVYLSVRCEEPRMDALKEGAKERDEGSYYDDSCEIFFDSTRSKASYYQIAVNSAGTIYDASGNDPTWSPKDLIVKPWKENAAWGFEISVPILAMGYGPGEVDTPNKPMAFAIFRNRYLPGRKEPQRTSWLVWPERRYRDPRRFFPLDVGKKCEGRTVSHRYRGVEEAGVRLPLAWQLDDPLYEELMGHRALFGKDDSVGVMCIGRTQRVGEGTIPFALQHGMRFVHDEMLQIYKDYRLCIPGQAYYGPGLDPKRKHFQYLKLKQHGLLVDVTLQPKHGGRYYNYGSRPDPKTPGYLKSNRALIYSFVDPRVKDSYIIHAKTIADKHRDQLWGITLGHEDITSILTHYYDGLAKAYLEADDPMWKKWDAEIKEKYGFGRFGMPKSNKRATRFERIAFFRWFIQRYNKHLHEVAEGIRSVNPKLKIVSSVEQAGTRPFGYERIVGTFDYITQQLYWGKGMYRQEVAFHVKLAGDLARTPVRATPHIEHYFVSLSPAEANEVMSSAVRVGARQLGVWMCDWFGNTKTDYYGAPGRFREILNCLKQFGEMRELKSPTPDTAILYSNISEYAASWRQGRDTHEWAFTLLGPRARSWFDFVSDFQIVDATADLSKYKVLYVPAARYQDDETLAKILQFVRGGGTLVLNSRHPFRWRPDGTERKEFVKEVMGVELGKKMGSAGSIALVENVREFLPACNTSAKAKLPLYRQEHAFVPLEGTAVLGTHDDGSPILAMKKLGKGKVITFASTPFHSGVLPNEAWWTFFKELQESLGCETGHGIWRFRFPRLEKPFPDLYPKGLMCLTGNAAHWREERVVEGPNLHLKGHCSYEPGPDLISEEEEASQKGWRFAHSNLFDRPASLKALPCVGIAGKRRGEGAELARPWIVAWKALGPVHVRLAFEGPLQAQELRLWVHGDAPDVEIGAVAGGKYEKLASANAEGNTAHDVRELHLQFPRTAGNVFEIRFAERKQGPLYLSEVELWGSDP